MMKLIVFLLFSITAFAGTMPNNDYKLGVSSSTELKGFTFDTGDGANNVQLKVNDAKSLIYSGNIYQIGDGSSSNSKDFIFDPASSTSLRWNGSDNYVELRSEKIRVGKDADNDITLEFGKGGSNPFVKYDSTKGKIRFSNDGTTVKDLGSGSGSGGGENFNNGFTADQNANAEDGDTGWTASAGSFGTTAIDPLEGDQSFTWTPNAQNDTLTSPILNFNKDIFKGTACQANFTYIGGDENLTMQVIDGNNDVLGELVLNAHTITSNESVFFLCPSNDAIVGDSEKGNLRFRLLNEGASASALIKFDKVYVGTLIGLTETTLPDTLSAYIQSNGTITTYSTDWLNNCNNDSTGYISCYFKSGTFSTSPICGATNLSGTDTTTTINQISSTFVQFRSMQSGASFNTALHIWCEKQGADAKQSVQVYKSIPKVSEYKNNFDARVSSTGVVSGENADWINGNCTVTSGVTDCNLNTIGITQNLLCTATVDVATFDQGVTYDFVNSTTSLIKFRGFVSSTGGPADRNLIIKCAKQGVDQKAVTVNPIVIPNAVFYGPYDLTVSGTNWTTSNAKGVFYVVNGEWYIGVEGMGSLSVAASTFTLSISGVNFAYNNIPLASSGNNAGTWVTPQTFITQPSGGLYIRYESTVNSVAFSGLIKLSGKPSLIP